MSGEWRWDCHRRHATDSPKQLAVQIVGANTIGAGGHDLDAALSPFSQMKGVDQLLFSSRSTSHSCLPSSAHEGKPERIKLLVVVDDEQAIFVKGRGGGSTPAKLCPAPRPSALTTPACRPCRDNTSLDCRNTRKCVCRRCTGVFSECIGVLRMNALGRLFAARRFTRLPNHFAGFSNRSNRPSNDATASAAFVYRSPPKYRARFFRGLRIRLPRVTLSENDAITINDRRRPAPDRVRSRPKRRSS